MIEEIVAPTHFEFQRVLSDRAILLNAMIAIADALDARFDRLGRLETSVDQGNALRALRMHYQTAVCRNNIDGSVLVARAVIKEVTA